MRDKHMNSVATFRLKEERLTLGQASKRATKGMEQLNHNLATGNPLLPRATLLSQPKEDMLQRHPSRDTHRQLLSKLATVPRILGMPPRHPALVRLLG